MVLKILMRYTLGSFGLCREIKILVISVDLGYPGVKELVLLTTVQNVR
jgi:hypothetical protein